MHSLVSVIITTKNEENHIRDCLNSIKNQTYPAELIEIIIVDNNSDDRTKDISREFTEKVFDYGPERSAQRNFGIKQANGEYILYLDADMMLSKDVIKECVEKCESGGCIALYIQERIIGEGFWIKVRDFERSFYNATVIDCVRFFPKENFLILNGFDETISGPEDWDFDRRIRQLGSVDTIQNCLYHNESDFNITTYIRRKMYYAKSFTRYIDKWGRNDPEIKKQLGFAYRMFTVFTEDKKWINLLKHPILTLGMFFLRLAVGINYALLKYNYSHKLVE